MSVGLFEAIVVNEAPDPELPGYISVKIPELFGDAEVPEPIPPLFPGGISGWGGITPSTAPPADETIPDNATDVKVTVIRIAPETFRWFGTSQGWKFLTDNAGKVCGARSPDGKKQIYLSNDDGFFAGVTDDFNTFHRIAIGTDGKIQVLRNDDGGGMEADSTSTRIIGTIVKVTTDATGATTTEMMVLGESYMTDELAALTEVMTAVAALGFPVTNLSSFITNLGVSLGAGPPYLSTVGEVE